MPCPLAILKGTTLICLGLLAHKKITYYKIFLYTYAKH